MSTNETTTTAVIFLGAVLAVLAAGTVIAVKRGEMAWPPGSGEEKAEPAKPPEYINFGARPSFSARAQPKLKTDKDEEVIEEPGPALSLPPLDSVGIGLSVVGIVWLLVEAFSQGTIWGCAVLFGNLLGGIAFLFAYPKRAWRPFSVQCVGYLALIWAAVSTA
jgi:hypothetical protein